MSQQQSSTRMLICLSRLSVWLCVTAECNTPCFNHTDATVEGGRCRDQDRHTRIWVGVRKSAKTAIKCYLQDSVSLTGKRCNFSYVFIEKHVCYTQEVVEHGHKYFHFKHYFKRKTRKKNQFVAQIFIPILAPAGSSFPFFVSFWIFLTCVALD